LAEQGQVSERFSRAVEQLGATNADKSPAVDVRTGALFSLMRIGLDSPVNRQPAFLVVASYVRNNYGPPAEPRPDGCKASFRFLQPDVSVALKYVLPTLAASLPARSRGDTVLGLRGATLDGLAVDELALERFNLSGVKLRDASLNKADFRGATLSNARFDRACLHDADFRDATVTGARFAGAHLQRAKFTRRTLAQAGLSEAQRREIAPVEG